MGNHNDRKNNKEIYNNRESMLMRKIYWQDNREEYNNKEEYNNG